MIFLFLFLFLFLLLYKIRDKNRFKTEYASISKLLDLNSDLLNKFKIAKRKKPQDFMIDLEKLLQVVLAFVSIPQDAIQNKSKLLKPDSEQYKKVLEFIKSPEVTINTLIDLYLLYVRAEAEKKASSEGVIPIPFYMIHCFAKNDCANSALNISKNLENAESIDKLVKFYKVMSKVYFKAWKNRYKKGSYNDMIKDKSEDDLLDQAQTAASAAID